VYRNTKLAVIEAKAWDEALTEGVGQARTTRASWLFGSPIPRTGRAIYAIDMETGKECDDLTHYPTQTNCGR